jgi:phage nucleotide-binding protein
MTRTGQILALLAVKGISFNSKVMRLSASIVQRGGKTMASNVKPESVKQSLRDVPAHLMIYGFNGTGKTTFAGKTDLITVFLDCGDAGIRTLKNEDPKRVRVIRIRSTNQYLDTIDYLIQQADKFDLLVADTLTGLASIAIREVKGKRGGEMNQNKWGKVSSKVIECIMETRNFPKEVIYLAQERRKTKEDENGSYLTISPSLTPSVREVLSGCVDWVGRLYVQDGKRKLTFIYTDETEAKDRSELFPKVIVQPSYAPIRKRIMESTL